MKKPVQILLAASLLMLCLPSAAIDHPGIAEKRTAPGRFSLIQGGVPAAVVTDPADQRGVLIKTFRMKQAAYLLANNKVNVSEVAYRVGFSSHSYFSNAFREYFGMSPREFVTRIQENPDDASLKQLFE